MEIQSEASDHFSRSDAPQWFLFERLPRQAKTIPKYMKRIGFVRAFRVISSNRSSPSEKKARTAIYETHKPSLT